MRPRYDKRRSHEDCRDIEDRYNLYWVSRPGQGAQAWSSGGEVNMAARKGRPVVPRETAAPPGPVDGDGRRG